MSSWAGDAGPGFGPPAGSSLLAGSPGAVHALLGRTSQTQRHAAAPGSHLKCGTRGSQHPNPLLPHAQHRGAISTGSEKAPYSSIPAGSGSLLPGRGAGQGRTRLGAHPLRSSAARPCPLRWEPALSLGYADGNLHQSIIRR